VKHIHTTENKKLTNFIGKGGGLEDWERTIPPPMGRANKDCSTRFTNLKVPMCEILIAWIFVIFTQLEGWKKMHSFYIWVKYVPYFC
jgi:hypothetical protein